MNSGLKDIHFILICLSKPNHITGVLNSFQRPELPSSEAGTLLSVGLLCFHLFEEQTMHCAFFPPL